MIQIKVLIPVKNGTITPVSPLMRPSLPFVPSGSPGKKDNPKSSLPSPFSLSLSAISREGRFGQTGSLSHAAQVGRLLLKLDLRGQKVLHFLEYVFIS